MIGRPVSVTSIGVRPWRQFVLVREASRFPETAIKSPELDGTVVVGSTAQELGEVLPRRVLRSTGWALMKRSQFSEEPYALRQAAAGTARVFLRPISRTRCRCSVGEHLPEDH
jgi:hypothetical protein